MSSDGLYEIFKATLTQKEQQRFMRLIQSETLEPARNTNITLRQQILRMPKRKIPNTK